MPDKQQKYFGEAETLSDPSDSAEPVVPSDTDPLPDGPCKYLFIGTGGTLKARGMGDEDWREWKNLPNGSFLPHRIAYVHTDSDAADLLAHY